MRAVAEGGANAAAPMREAALTEGAILHHLVVGMSSAQVSQSPSHFYICGLVYPSMYGDSHAVHQCHAFWASLNSGRAALCCADDRLTRYDHVV